MSSGTSQQRRAPGRDLQAALAACAQQDYASAFRQLARIAEKGEGQAQYQLGLLYARGDGVVPSLADAVVWYRRAAEQGHAEAQYQLGIVCLHGGAPQWDADRRYEGGAQIDRDAAARNRELLFPNGLRVLPDQNDAFHWCHAAAEQGLVDAQAALAF